MKEGDKRLSFPLKILDRLLYSSVKRAEINKTLKKFIASGLNNLKGQLFFLPPYSSEAEPTSSSSSFTSFSLQMQNFSACAKEKLQNPIQELFAAANLVFSP